MNGGEEFEDRLVQIDLEPVVLEGNLCIPSRAEAIVLFAHGGGSGRNSPHNRFVARTLQEGGLATLLPDLLTPEEAELDVRTRRLRFDIDFLALRVIAVTDWLAMQACTKDLRIGCFGTRAAAAACLMAARERPKTILAVVSPGGRSDLAGSALPGVEAPTLLIVGANDVPVLGLNREALRSLRCENRLEVIPNATHLFPETGALERVAILARDWFTQHLGAASASAQSA